LQGIRDATLDLLHILVAVHAEVSIIFYSYYGYLNFCHDTIAFPINMLEIGVKNKYLLLDNLLSSLGPHDLCRTVVFIYLHQKKKTLFLST